MAILTGPEIRRLATPVPARDLCNEFVFHDGQPRQVLAASHAPDYSDVCLAVGGVRQWERMDADRLLQRCGPRGERLAISPYDQQWTGPNSHDVHLGDTLKVYDLSACPLVLDPVSDRYHSAIDPKNPPPTFDLPKVAVRDQWLLMPGTGYLGSIRERVECHGLVPYFDGRSSTGRLFVSLHQTAGRGDDGWGGYLTCEITVTHPILLEPGDRLGQFTFHTLTGERQEYTGRYQDQPAEPVPSRFHLKESP